MPEVTLEDLGLSTEIIVNAPNVQKGLTEWKRQAVVLELVHRPLQRITSITMRLSSFQKEEGDTYGPQLNNIPEEIINIVADNTTIVDMTGTILLTDIHSDTDLGPHLIEGGILHGIQWMRQGNWFCMIATTTPVIVTDMIADYAYMKFYPPQPQTTTTTTTELPPETV